MMTDPLSDMLTRIRNAVAIEMQNIELPSSSLRKAVAQVLKDEGYIWDWEERANTQLPYSQLLLHLKYGPEGERVIRQIDRISRPGRRVYAGYRDLTPVLNGLGIQIVSTSRGVMSDRKAREAKLGGEVLCVIT